MVALVYKRSSEVPPPRYSSPLLPSSPFPLKFSSTTTPGSVSRNRMSLPKLCLLRLPPTPLPALRLRTRQPRPSPQSAASLASFTARFDRLSSMVARPAFLPAFFSRRLFGPPPFGPRRRLARRLYGGPLRRRSDRR